MDDAEDDDADGEDPDSDLDSWLVDDDEELDGPIMVDERELSPSLLPDLPPRTGKRKSDDTEKKTEKKRKVVIPLVPFSKGPCWEQAIGQCEDFMAPFRIQLFNGMFSFITKR
jgi:chromatin assembly factor 1 subunit A